MSNTDDSSARNSLLEAEAILAFLQKSKAANDENAEVIVDSLAKTARAKILDALETLPE